MLLLDDFVTINTLRLGVDAQNTVHHEAAALAELVDSPHGVDSTVQRAARVEVFLDIWQQIFARAHLAIVIGQVDPWVLKSFVGRHP